MKKLNIQKQYHKIITLLFLIILTGCSSYQFIPPLEPEIAELSDTQLRVINRNNYTWHNVSITVNDYYSCWEQDNLNPEGIIEVQALTCDQFAINHKYIYSILVETDEGKASFTR